MRLKFILALSIFDLCFIIVHFQDLYWMNGAVQPILAMCVCVYELGQIGISMCDFDHEEGDLVDSNCNTCCDESYEGMND